MNTIGQQENVSTSKSQSQRERATQLITEILALVDDEEFWSIVGRVSCND